MQHSLDLNGRDGRALDGGQQAAPERITDGSRKAALERLSGKASVGGGEGVVIDFHSLGTLKTLPKHW